MCLHKNLHINFSKKYYSRNFLAIQFSGWDSMLPLPRGKGLIPVWGTEIPQTVWPKQKEKKGLLIIAKRLNQSILKEVNSIFTGRTGAEAEAPILWPPDGKNRLLGKDPEDEIVEWHH